MVILNISLRSQVYFMKVRARDFYKVCLENWSLAVLTYFFYKQEVYKKLTLGCWIAAIFRVLSLPNNTAQKMTFSIKYFFSNCDQIRSLLRFSHIYWSIP